MNISVNRKKNKMFLVLIVLVSWILIATAFVLATKKEKVVLEYLDESWGLGTAVTESVSNDRDYEWYVDQFTTGEYSKENSGVAATEMIFRWKDKNATIKAKYIRENIIIKGRDAEVGMINLILRENEIKNRGMAVKLNPSLFETSNERIMNNVKEEIKKGNIVLVGFDTKFLTKSSNGAQRCGRYYENDFKHFVIVKGYKIVDEKLYFEVYEPYSDKFKHQDGTPWGKNRYYLANDVMEGTFCLISIYK